MNSCTSQVPPSQINPSYGLRLWRRIWTRPVREWERRRRYGIRAKCRQLAPISITPSPRLLAVLTTPGVFTDAMWAAWSWFRFLHGDFELTIFVDGSFDHEKEDLAAAIFPGIRVAGVSSAIEVLCASHPVLGHFTRNHPLGRKLALILALQQQGAVLFSDHDVLAFNSPHEIFSRLGSGHPLYIEEEHHGVFDPAILARAAQLGLSHAPALNSGLLYLPSGSLSVDLAASLLAGWQPPMNSWFTEQTVLSVLLQQAGGLPLPRERYVVSNRRQFYWERDVDYSSIAVRHFTGPVRHVMYSKGMPELWRRRAERIPDLRN